MVILIIAGLVTFALVYTKTVDANQFLQENDMYINMLKEKDWDFYVAAKYGDRVNADELFNKRIKNTFWAVAIVMLVLFTNFNALFALELPSLHNCSRRVFLTFTRANSAATKNPFTNNKNAITKILTNMSVRSIT